MTTRVLTTEEAAVQFFTARPEMRTNEVRLRLAHAFTEYMERTGRDIGVLRSVALAIGIPDIEVLCKKTASPHLLSASDEALQECLAQMRAYLDRWRVVEERGIREGQEGYSTESDHIEEGVKVVRVEPHFHLCLLLRDGSMQRVGPGQFVSYERDRRQEARQTNHKKPPERHGPIGRARRLALSSGCSAQDRAMLLRDIIRVSKDPDDILHLEDLWRRSRRAHESTHSNIGETLLDAYLTCGRLSEAVNLFPTITDASNQLRALLHLFANTQDQSYLEQARDSARSSSIPRQMALSTVAKASKRSADYREAQAAIEVAMTNYAVKGLNTDSIRLTAVSLFVELGDFQKARDTLRFMQNGTFRVEGNSFLALRSRSNSDLQTMYTDLQQLPALKAGILPEVASAFLACREYDALRRLAFFRSRSHDQIMERCYLYARLAVESEGIETDLRACKEAYNHTAFQERANPSLRSLAEGQYAKVLASKGRLEDALLVVKGIQTPLVKGRTYIAIHHLDNENKER